MLAEMEMGDSIRFSGEFVVDATGAPRHQEIDAFYVWLKSIEPESMDREAKNTNLQEYKEP
jgi:hypothetical protein